MATKAFITYFPSAGASEDSIVFSVSYIDTVNNIVMENISGQLFFGTDLITYTPVEVQTAMQNKIIAYSVTKGYGVTASDITFGVPNMFTPNEVIAVKAATQLKTFTTPTFTTATTATQLSTTQIAEVSYAFDASLALTLLVGQSVRATLTYADNSAMTTNPKITDTSILLSSGLAGLNQTNTLKLTGYIPIGKYRKVTFAVTGGATAPTTIAAGQEMLVPA